MRTLAIVPVKRFELAKQRLGERLDDAQREALARAMVEDVLHTLAATSELDGVLVITNEAPVAELARTLGALVADDPREAGQSAAAAIGIAYAQREGIERVLLVPGDCPSLDASELTALLGLEDDRAPLVVIVPDRHGTGTNALLLSPPAVIAPAFGPGSFERHRELARAAGARCEVARAPTLMLDVDTPEDLAALLATRRDRAPRTRAVLATFSDLQ